MENPLEVVRELVGRAPDGIITLRAEILGQLLDEIERAEENADLAELNAENWSARALHAEEHAADLRVELERPRQCSVCGSSEMPDARQLVTRLQADHDPA